MTKLKPGRMTSELWMSVIRQLLMIGVTLGVLTGLDVDNFLNATNELVDGIVKFGMYVTPILIAAVDAWKYMAGRIELKKEALRNR